MNNIILVIVAVFFAVGAIDYLKQDRFKLGTAFEEGIKTMGGLAISMVGILSITPMIGDLISRFILPYTESVGLDPSVLSSSFLAIDMGALNIARDLSNTDNMVAFSGILMGSMVGCTISFTLPLALGMIKGEARNELSIGMLCGIATLPIGLFIGGVILKIETSVLIINLIPIMILAVILAFGLIYKQELLMKGFNILGKAILYISIIGLILQGVTSITGIVLVKKLMPLDEALVTVGKIAIFLAGAYVMLEFIKMKFKKPLDKLGEKIGVNSYTVAAFIGSFASAIIIFSTFNKLDKKGRVLCSAFAVGGAYVFGGQMGYVASQAPQFLNVYIITKLICGLLAICFAMIIIKIEK